MILKNAVRHSCSFDMLRIRMRELYYELTAQNVRATHIIAGQSAIIGYESTLMRPDRPVTWFKDLPVKFDAAVPTDEMRFYKGAELVGEVRHIT